MVILSIIIILLLIAIFLFKYLEHMVKQNLGKTIKQLFEETKNYEDNQIKNVSGMDNVLLKTIEDDFPTLNIEQLKRQAEKDLENEVGKNITIHKNVILSYKKTEHTATLTFGISYEYNKEKLIQERAKVEYIYSIDPLSISKGEKAKALNCPNCGAPITNLGVKKCKYCKTVLHELTEKVWILNEIKKY